MSRRPEWLNDVELTLGAESRVGIAVGISDVPNKLTHAGILYWDQGAEPRILHMAFHACVSDETLRDSAINYYWSELPFDDDMAAAVAGYCRRVGKNRPKIPYGIVYEGGQLADDGSAIISGRTIGLTCATYVLAVFSSVGHDLINIATWMEREDDTVWHDLIVAKLREFHSKRPDLLAESHIEAVQRERGCTRFRPEEVAAAASVPMPADFCTAEPLGIAAKAFLLMEDQTVE